MGNTTIKELQLIRLVAVYNANCGLIGGLTFVALICNCYGAEVETANCQRYLEENWTPVRKLNESWLQPRGRGVTPLTFNEFKLCAKRRRVAFFGDSILRNIYQELIRLDRPDNVPLLNGSGQLKLLAKSKTVKGLRFSKLLNQRYYTYTSGSTVVDFFDLRNTEVFRSVAVKVVKKGRYSDVVMSNALWDMGLNFRGLMKYSIALDGNVRSIRSALPADGKTLILGLHFVNASRCASDVRCKVCNHKVVQAFIRRVQQKTACVHGATLVNTEHFTYGPCPAEHSPDGTHFDSALTAVQMQYVLNAFCTSRHYPEPAALDCVNTLSIPTAQNIISARLEVASISHGLKCSAAFDELLQLQHKMQD